MKTQNYLCPECHVCSYCLQRGTYPCTHPIDPIRGHCVHHKDILPKDCAICVAKVTLSNTLLKVAALKATIETNETLAEWESDARTEQLLKYLAETGELRAEMRKRTKDSDRVVYDLNNRISELLIR